MTIRETPTDRRPEPSSEFFNTRRAIQRMLQKADAEYREQTQKLQQAAADVHGGEQ